MNLEQQLTADWSAAHRFAGLDMLTHRMTTHHTVPHALLVRSEKYPHSPCITELVSGCEGRTLSYAELAESVRRRAAALSCAGVSRESLLGLAPRNDIDSITTILAAMWLGAAVVLVNPRDANERLAEQFSSVRAVDFRDVESKVRRQERIRGIDASVPSPLGRPNDVAVVVFTSGSTGLPRAVAQSNYNVMVNCAAVAELHGIDSSTRLLGCLPLFHVNALHFTGFATLLGGGHLFIADKFDQLTYLKTLSHSRCHIASVVPSILNAVLADRRLPPSLPDLRYFVSAAAPLTAQTARRCRERFGARIVQGFGLSEAGNFSCVMPTLKTEKAYQRVMIDTDVPPVGVAVWGNEVAVIRPDGNPAALGEVGEVVIRGHNVMLGYLNDPEATANVFRGGHLHTGDLGLFCRTDGVRAPVLKLTGRLKNVVKVGGHAVSLEEVERVVVGLPGVAEAAACGIGDALAGEKLALAIVVHPDIDLQVHQIKHAIRKRLGPDHVPTIIETLSALPLLANGKLARQRLPALISQLQLRPSESGDK